MLSSILPSLIAFAAVLLMIPGVLWLVKRSQSLRPRQGGGALAVVAGVAVGPRERIAVVQAAERFLVVGITGQSIALLATLDEWPNDPTALANPSPFSALLQRMNQNAQKGA
jgi:flagellar protein FliO/FliZ